MFSVSLLLSKITKQSFQLHADLVLGHLGQRSEFTVCSCVSNYYKSAFISLSRQSIVTTCQKPESSGLTSCSRGSEIRPTCGWSTSTLKGTSTFVYFSVFLVSHYSCPFQENLWLPMLCCLQSIWRRKALPQNFSESR